MRLIDEQYTRRPFFGSPKITDWLRKQGHKVNHKRVERLMRVMGLQAICPKRGLSQPAPGHRIYPYLLRDVRVTRANQVWSTDITYIRLERGFVYLVAIIDWFSRYVLAWEISTTLDTSFCVSALEWALAGGAQPEIFNTDQGSQFTAEEFTSVVLARGCKLSMDGRGAWRDNVFVERLWRSVKYEEVYLKAYDSVGAARTSLAAYFTFYNERRPHQSHDGQTPDVVYFNSLPQTLAAA